MPTSTIVARRLALLQSFKESTWGTGGTATAKWMGVKPQPQFIPFFTQERIEEQRGSVVPAWIAPLLKKGGTFKLGGTVTYEDVNYMLYGGLNAPVVTGAGPYTYTYTGPGTSAWTVQSYTLEYGTTGANNAIVANGCTFQKVSFKGEKSKPIEYDADGFYATHTTNGVFTGSPTDRVVQAVLTPELALSIDPAGAAFGTTAYASTLRSFSLDISSGLSPIYTAGSLSPIGFVYDKMDVALSLTLLYTSSVRTLLNGTLFAGTGVNVRLDATNGANRQLRFDVAGNITSDVGMWDDEDGAQAVTVKVEGVYDSTIGAWFNALVKNNVSALP